jgi:hypothetical protein
MSDPYYDQTVLFLPFEPTASSLVGTATYPYDYSKYHRVVKTPALSNITSITNPKYGAYAGYFNGSNTVKYDASSGLDFGTGDFTIEFWVYPTVTWSTQSSPGLIGKKTTDTTSGWQIYKNNALSTTKMGARLTSTLDFFSNTDVPNNTWSHWCLQRSGTNLYWFFNGNLDKSGTSTANISDTADLNLGYSQTWGGYFNGYLDDIRITTGVARYPTSGFTPSQITIADYPTQTGTSRVIQDHYNKSHFDFNSLSKTKRVITDHYNKSHFDFNALAKAGRLIPVREKNSIRDWSALARVGRTCVKEENARNDFNSAAFGSLNIATQGTISGIIKIFGSPVKRKVRLHESQSGAFVREMWSGDDGTYLFTGLRKELLYTITATDYAEQYNDVIGTNISPI